MQGIGKIENKTPIIAIVGPTATGKTDISIEIAKKFSGEIISADSMQIYKEFKICTAKPTEIQMKTIKHYMIDEISVKDSYSVANYVKEAQRYIQEIRKKGKIPLVVGGTGLYIDALLGNFSLEEKKIDMDIRNNLQKRAINNSAELFNELVKVDGESSKKIHPNDTKRIIRALEFYYSFGYPISNQIKETLKKDSLYDTIFIGLNFRDRKILYDKIEKRVDCMFEQGLIQETEKIFNSQIGKTACGAIGYKEIIPYLNTQISLVEAKENVKKETRAYAKRQITWFKRNKNINWLYVDEFNSYADLISESFKILKEKGFNEAD